jgi:hypothetical protein
VPTDYERLPFRLMLHECQRHYCKSFDYATAPAQSAGLTGALYGINCFATSGTPNVIAIQWRYPVAMRSAPTITLYNPSAANALIRQIAESKDSGTVTATAGTEGVGITATNGGTTAVVGNVPFTPKRMRGSDGLFPDQ